MAPDDAAGATATASAMPAAPAVPDAPAEADIASEHEPSPRPVLNTRKAEAPRGIDGFENPHDWIAEMGPDAAHGGRRIRLTPPSAPATVAASVTSPATTASNEIDSVLPPVAAVSDTLPSLVFVSGPHAGQSIALLPTSLTIGREHDNNVEIKDPDVARYHARILRERDEYVVEDLSSTTGTWVNGKRVQRAVITHGDVIRVGKTELALDFEWTMDTR